MTLLPWFESDFNALMQAGASMPHAILLHGQRGIGKRELALALAQSLLCEARPTHHQACGQCASCHWFLRGNHPDFKLIQPAWVSVNEPMLQALGEMPNDDDEPVSLDEEGAKKTKTLSRDIKIEQVRAVLDWVNVATHRGGARVLVIYPAEAMNAHAANALLKTLEEPPPATHFLLVTHRLDSLLPTIKSRCRLLPLTAPTTAQALGWLQQQGVENAATTLAYYGGAPLSAWLATQALARADAEKLQALPLSLADPAQLDPLALAESLQKMPMTQIIAAIQRWIYDIISLTQGGVVRYHVNHEAQLVQLQQQLHKRDANKALMQFAQRLTEAQRLAGHPLAAKLVLESLCLAYRQLFH